MAKFLFFSFYKVYYEDIHTGIWYEMWSYQLWSINVISAAFGFAEIFFQAITFAERRFKLVIFSFLIYLKHSLDILTKL